MKALFTLDMDEETQGYLRDRAADGVKLLFAGARSEAALIGAAQDVDVLVGPRHLEAILDACAQIRLVQIPWAGVEREAAIVRERGQVRLANLHANAYATAQYAVALLLALVNQVPVAHALVREGRWPARDALPPSDTLQGKTVGILGAGAIGREAANLLVPFEVRLIGLHRGVKDEAPPPFVQVFGADDLAVFLDAADAVLVSVPATPATEGLLGASELRRLAPGGYLVNIARGAVVDERALYEALQTRQLAGAAIDVWYDYDPAPDDTGRAFPYRLPFHELPNVVLSPHRAGDARYPPSYWDDVIENINRLAAGRHDLLNIVDLERGY